MKAHARLSPSSAHRWTRCPGSIREEAKYPDNQSQASLSGTYSHELLQFTLGNDTCPTKWIGEHLLAIGLIVDEERAHRVKIAYDYIISLLDFIKSNIGGKIDFSVEQKVNSEKVTKRHDLFGTIDAHILYGNRCEIIDYKDGYAPVQVENNEQLELYAICCLADHPELEHFRLTIIQPRVADIGLPVISHWDVTREYLIKRTKDYIRYAQLTDKDDALLIPGETQCKYCKAKGSCSAFSEYVLSNLEYPEGGKEAQYSQAGSLSNDKIYEIIKNTPMIREFLEAVSEEAIRRMNSDNPITGLTLSKSKKHKIWSLPEEDMSNRLLKMGIPKAHIYEKKIISPSKAVKLRWMDKKGEEKRLTDNQISMLDTQYIIKPDGITTVVVQNISVSINSLFEKSNSKPTSGST